LNGLALILQEVNCLCTLEITSRHIWC